MPAIVMQSFGGHAPSWYASCGRHEWVGQGYTGATPEEDREARRLAELEADEHNRTKRHN